jgi:hypothetical protein
MQVPLPVSPFRFLVLLAAVILLVLKAVGVDSDSIDLGWLGLALGFGSFLVP